MDQEFWDERWTSGRIAFHQPTPNQFLMSHWRNLGLSGGDSVFVPLCGKSLDMVWLAQAGHRVVGVEFNQLAVDAFFEENNLSRTVSERDGFTVSSGENIEIWCGDFFALPAAVVADVRGVYDRASLVALPTELRQRYAARMIELLGATTMLLSSIEYDQAEMPGPPFSVRRDEIEGLYSGHFAIETVVHEDAPDELEQFRERGMTSARRAIYMLRPRQAQAGAETGS